MRTFLFYYFFSCQRVLGKTSTFYLHDIPFKYIFKSNTKTYPFSFNNNLKLYNGSFTFETDSKAIHAYSGQSIKWQFCLCRQTILLVQCSLIYSTILDGKYFIWNKINNFITIRMPTWQNRPQLNNFENILILGHDFLADQSYLNIFYCLVHFLKQKRRK